MSSSLHWRPPASTSSDLPEQLKLVLRKKHGQMRDFEIGGDEYDYLEGLRDAGVDGAQELLDLIDKHGKVFLTESW